MHIVVPIGSISSMEVNVNFLDQMELTDISDQEGLDVFFSSVGEEGVLTSPLPGNNNHSEDAISNGLFQHVLESFDAKSIVSSASSKSSFDSQTMNVTRENTPVVGSDNENTPNTVKCRAISPKTEEGKIQN